VVSVYAIQPAIVEFFTTSSAALDFSNFWYGAVTAVGLGHIISQLRFEQTVAFGFGVVGSGIWDFTLYKLWAFKSDSAK
jgi:hypothetical protein